jgi:hypothetical protein
MKLTKNDLDTMQKVSYCTGIKLTDIKNIFFYFLLTLIIDAYFGNLTFSLPYIGSITIPEKNQEKLLMKETDIEFKPSIVLNDLIKDLKENKVSNRIEQEVENKIVNEIMT